MARRRDKLNDRGARHDVYHQRAKREQFAARAIYKLEELDKKFRLLRPGGRVLDLGCWPGSWMQYAADRVGSQGHVLGVDLRAVTIALPEHVEHRVVDVLAWEPEPALRERPFDVLISDMAPQTTGDRKTDQFRSEELCERALELASLLLRPGGHFACKVFQGERFPALLAALRVRFQEARSFHTAATRAGSREQYLVGRGHRPEKAS